MPDRKRRLSPSLITNALQPGGSVPARFARLAANLARRFRGGHLHDCCGHYGEPGC